MLKHNPCNYFLFPFMYIWVIFFNVVSFLSLFIVIELILSNNELKTFMGTFYLL